MDEAACVGTIILTFEEELWYVFQIKMGENQDFSVLDEEGFSYRESKGLIDS